MDYENFSKKLIHSIQRNFIDENLLSKETKFVRAQYFFGLISLLNKIINYFDFKNEIKFFNGKPYIKINNIYLQIVNQYFLKKVKKSFVSKADLIILFLKKYNFQPKIIIDIGACWGEYSLILAKEYNDSEVYAVEGSSENYKILCNNIDSKLNNINNIKTFNTIISDSNDFKFIKNNISTTNFVKDEKDGNEAYYSQFSKVKSNKLSNFLLENKLNKIDFLKLDIEGHELKLIKDLLNLDLKFGLIEIINMNSIEKNCEFLNQLSLNYNLFDGKKFNLIDEEKYKELVTNNFKNSPSFDIFIVSKKIYKNYNN